MIAAFAVEYVGNLVDAPEKYVVTLAAKISGAVIPGVIQYGSFYLQHLAANPQFR